MELGDFVESGRYFDHLSTHITIDKGRALRYANSLPSEDATALSAARAPLPTTQLPFALLSDYLTSGLPIRIASSQSSQLPTLVSTPPDIAIAEMTAEVGTGVLPRYAMGQSLPVSLQLTTVGEIASEPMQLRFFLSHDSTVSVSDQFLGAQWVSPTTESLVQTVLDLPPQADEFWLTASEQVYIGAILQSFDGETDITNNEATLELNVAIPELFAYDFTYHYTGDARVLGDFYRGQVIAPVDFYQVGQWVDVTNARTEADTDGRYQITASRSYSGGLSAGTVTVADYFDYETFTWKPPAFASGQTYLGSESGYLQPRAWSIDRFGRDIYEADVWSEQSALAQLAQAAPVNDPKIQALLSPSRSYWDSSANDGVLTFSFVQNPAIGHAGNEQLYAVSQGVQQNVRQILDDLSQIINVDFVEVAESAGQVGQLRYLSAEDPGAPFYAFAYNPDAARASSVYLNRRYDHSDANSGFAAAPGSVGYQTLLHETLHALGLKHPSPDNADGDRTPPPYLPAALDNNSQTVMSYNDVGAYAVTPMNLDIAALQHLYGSRVQREDDTVYRFTSLTEYVVDRQQVGTSNSSKQVLLDSGGFDTLDFSGLSIARNNRFDLRPGGWLTTEVAFDGQSYRVAGDAQSYVATTAGVVLSDATLIENWVTSVGNDYVIANGTGNQFLGYRFGQSMGRDVIAGSDWFDQLVLQDYRLADVTPTISGDTLHLQLADDGQVTIQDYFQKPLTLVLPTGRYLYDRLQGWQSLG